MSGFIETTGSAPPSGAAGGDLSGSYPSPTVTKIEGNAIKPETEGAAQDGYGLIWVNADGYYEAKPLAGDVTGSLRSNIVSSISGSSPIAITPAILQWAKSTSSPGLTHQAQTTNIATTNFTITPQAPFASATLTNRTAGSLVVNLAAPTNSGTTEAYFQVQRLGQDGIFMGWDSVDGATAIYGSARTAASIGSEMIACVDNGSTTSVWMYGSASLQLFTGAGIVAALNATTASTTLNDASLSSQEARLSITYQTAGVGGDTLVKGGAAKTSTGTNGGNVLLKPGAKDGAGTDGNVIVQTSGGGTVATFSSSLFTSSVAATIGAAAGTNTLTGALKSTVRSSSGNFTLDTTTTDKQVVITASQTVTLSAGAHAAGREVDFIIDTTSTGSNGSSIVLVIAPASTEKINGVNANLTTTVLGDGYGEIVTLRMRGDGTNVRVDSFSPFTLSNVSTIVSSYTIDGYRLDEIIICDTTNNNITLTLPAPLAGRSFTVIDKANTFNTHNLTLAQHASEKINGVAASLVLSNNGTRIGIVSDGTDYYTSV